MADEDFFKDIDLDFDIEEDMVDIDDDFLDDPESLAEEEE